MSLEVMSKLSRCDQERIEQLLGLCVMSLSIGQDLAHIGHRLLNKIGLPFFFSLSDENHADHVSSGRDVK
jgi:hypothetical protein